MVHGSPIAHIADPTTWVPHTAGVLTVLLLATALVVEHHIVKEGRFRLALMRRPAAAMIVVALAAVVAPLPSLAQDDGIPVGLPDLIADPPVVWFIKDIDDFKGEHIRAFAFDGYLHNIGTGSLEISGNPQIEGGMRQRVYNGETWEVVASPRVQFETNDGHNHFHFMEAAEYGLWNDARTEQIELSNKVGFCLIDTEPIESETDPLYSIADSDYCLVDQPDSTALTMGISPGWRDTYDANVTFQWVDVSDIRPGHYWASAIVDPLDQIVESNEANNTIVFSSNRYAVPGYVARNLSTEHDNGTITLKADAFGIVGDRGFVIDEPPSHGRLDYPAGVDILGQHVRYTPNPGFTGTDSFSYYAHDVSAPFPFTPVTAEVQIKVDDNSGSPHRSEPDLENASITVPPSSLDTANVARIQLEAPGLSDDVVWLASGLPHGLSLDPQSGVISGLPSLAGSYDATLYVKVGAGMVTAKTTMVVTAAEREVLEAQNDFSTPALEQQSIQIGIGKQGAMFETSGLPPGITLSDSLPLLFGTPEEAGSFVVTVREVVDGEAIKDITFEWVVRGSVHPAFPL